MRTRACLLLCCLVLGPWSMPPAAGAEPKAFLVAPAEAVAGQVLLLKFTGTVSEGDLTILQVSGPPAEPTVVYARDGRPACAIAQPLSAGDYTYALAAIGTPPGATAPAFAFALRTVRVAAPVPVPPPQPQPNPPADPAQALGRAYATGMAAWNASAWTAYADALEAGKTMSDAQAVFRSTWDENHRPWIDANLGPAVTAIVPVGKEPDATQRAALVVLARGIAAGSKCQPAGRGLR